MGFGLKIFDTLKSILGKQIFCSSYPQLIAQQISFDIDKFLKFT
jgi:hypothetical protein